MFDQFIKFMREIRPTQEDGSEAGTMRQVLADAIDKEFLPLVENYLKSIIEFKLNPTPPAVKKTTETKIALKNLFSNEMLTKKFFLLYQSNAEGKSFLAELKLNITTADKAAAASWHMRLANSAIEEYKKAFPKEVVTADKIVEFIHIKTKPVEPKNTTKNTSKLFGESGFQASGFAGDSTGDWATSSDGNREVADYDMIDFNLFDSKKRDNFFNRALSSQTKYVDKMRLEEDIKAYKQTTLAQIHQGILPTDRIAVDCTQQRGKISIERKPIETAYEKFMIALDTLIGHGIELDIIKSNDDAKGLLKNNIKLFLEHLPLIFPLYQQSRLMQTIQYWRAGFETINRYIENYQLNDKPLDITKEIQEVLAELQAKIKANLSQRFLHNLSQLNLKNDQEKCKEKVPDDLEVENTGNEDTTDEENTDDEDGQIDNNPRP